MANQTKSTAGVGVLKQLRGRSRQLNGLVTLVQQQWRSCLPWLQHWQLVAGFSLLTSVGISGLSLWLLLRQPTTPGNCDFVLWPLASASFRLYCAQQAAERHTLEDLLQAIDLIDDLPRDHPLAPEINRRLEAWSDQVLALAEAAFHEGQLHRAIAFARRIPRDVEAYTKVEERIQRWQQIWQEGEEIYRRAEAALKNLEWREAFQISLQLQFVDCRYWAQDQFGAFNERIIRAQREDRQLDEARALMASGDADQLAAAIEIVRQIPPTSDIYPGARRLLNQLGERLLELAIAALNRYDPLEARRIARLIPRDVRSARSAEDVVKLAAAEEFAQAGMGQDIDRAIAQARTITADRPLYFEAQQAIQRWQTDWQVLQTLAEAQAIARSGNIDRLRLALNRLNLPLAEASPYRQAQIRDQRRLWQRQIEIAEDQPLIDRANALARQGTPEALLQARQLLEQIRPQRALYETAQNRLKELFPPVATEAVHWQPDLDTARLNEAQRRARGGRDRDFAAAIAIAQEISPDSSVYAIANQLIVQWGNNILEQARYWVGRDNQQAIATAELIPPNHPLYPEARELIRVWQEAEPRNPF
ncbi:hypothetical protein NBE99_05080 [Thermosynechococcus sp. HN-54]|uniref:hypothetical protein n=1 Tax=Thermosynechococcus sp. HN-54 TaxID=2933959 RepID=UPI00202CC573|nr:hypothetical protein [Thermosynechococcus sp. HN-54]URR36512.1 hypothetical protein NBE99_05080 [Thermosynechococcus sp. HN-54]